MSATKTYKMTNFVGRKLRKDGTKDVASHLHVPVEIASVLRERGIDTFTVKVTEEGILYQPVLNEPKPEPLPAWLEPQP